jgi:hypothetical protein
MSPSPASLAIAARRRSPAVIAQAIQTGCRSLAMALTAVTTPPLPFREENSPSPSYENETGPRFEAMISGRFSTSMGAVLVRVDPVALRIFDSRAAVATVERRVTERTLDLTSSGPSAAARIHYAPNFQIITMIAAPQRTQ